MIFEEFKKDIRNFTSRDLIKFSKELDSATLAPDSIVRKYITNDAHFFLGIIELGFIVKIELTTRLEEMLPPLEEIS